MNTPATAPRTALAVDIDGPFQLVLAAWLSERAYRVVFLPLAEALKAPALADLLVCELAEPKRNGEQTLRQLAHGYPGTPLIALSPRFASGARCHALAGQLGAQAALAKPCSRADFHAALDTVRLPATGAHRHGGPPAQPGP